MTSIQENRILNYLGRITIALEKIASAVPESTDATHPIDADIQHVSYDAEQCGRNK